MTQAAALTESDSLAAIGDAPPPSAPGLVRTAAETVRMPLEPSGNRYRSDFVFRTLKFAEPLEIVFAPGETNRFFVIEKPGRIIAVTNLAEPEASVFLDLTDRVFHEQECGLLGMAFHPDFANNRRFYLSYTYSTSGISTGIYLRLSQFEASPDSPNQALRESEVPLISQHDGDPWHQGGNVKFGPDGYLYFSVGDGGESGPYNTQLIDAGFFSGILRLDVDNRPGSLLPNRPLDEPPNYRIPSDNPFVGLTHFNGLLLDAESVRTEFYAVGLRNPWRFAFDPLTGLLYSNDTGDARREEVNLIFKGENYGWTYFEGTLPHPNQLPPPPEGTLFTMPVAEYGYESGEAGTGKAIAAGILYRGSRFPELDGSYLFSDFWTGDIGRIPGVPPALLFDLRKTGAEIKALEDQIAALVPDIDKPQTAWEQRQLELETKWNVLNPDQFDSAGAAALTKERDRSIRAGGVLPWADVYSVEAETKLTGIKAVRLELLTDSKLPMLGPGRSPSANSVLTEFELYAAPQNNPAELQRIEILSAKADFEQPGFTVSAALDGQSTTGWAIAPAIGKAHEAVFTTREPFGFEDGTRLIFVLRQEFGAWTAIGRFRLSITTESGLAPNPLPFLSQIIRRPAPERTPEEQHRLNAYYRGIDPAILAITDQIANLRRERNEYLSHYNPSIEWIAWQPGVASFTIDPNTGDLLMPDMLQGLIHRLLPPDNSNPALQIPQTLAETGLFSDPVDLTPAPGVVPYEINAPFWSDGALKKRWFVMPNLDAKIGFHPTKNWSFENGMIWVKHFELPIDPYSLDTRKIETRVLVRNRLGVYGVTYRWDSDQKTATLVPPEGLTETISLGEGTQQTWHFPSRSECLQCHTTAGGLALGFNAPQLNRDVDLYGASKNQLLALSDAGFFHKQISNLFSVPALAALDDDNVSREFRVRSYLASNCSYCHQPGGSGRSQWDARISTPLAEASIVDASLSHGHAHSDDLIVKAGEPDHSLLWKRLAFLDARPMPPIGITQPDPAAVELIKSWILDDLPAMESFADWQKRHFTDPASIRAHPAHDADGDGAVNYIEYLTGKNPLDAGESWQLDIRTKPDSVELLLVRPVNRRIEIQWTTDLFDPKSWKPLLHPENRPIYAAREQLVSIELPLDQIQTFYRVHFVP